jgi:hypothetical protein
MYVHRFELFSFGLNRKFEVEFFAIGEILIPTSIEKVGRESMFESGHG